MRPHEHIRRGKGYCCERCDGPYKKWSKHPVMRRNRKRSDKQKAKKGLAR